MLIREILADFFRHGAFAVPPNPAHVTLSADFFLYLLGFDGSGADNFYDAGSCIDGRLTSAWNWCSQLEKKRYFHVFLLCGFSGFDGDW